MRFLTASFATASGLESGYEVWDKGCLNDCQAIIMGKQFYEEQGHCYVKSKGIETIILSFATSYTGYVII